MKKSKSIGSNILRFMIAAFFVVTVFLPLLTMFLQIGKMDVKAFVSSTQFKISLGNSLAVSLVSTVLCIAVAMILAHCITKSNINFKNILSIIFTLPMLIPSISHGMGLILLLGKNGIITNVLGLNSSIYGFGGIVIGSVLYASPVAFLMLVDVLKYEDQSVYEAADVLGVSHIHQFISITLPYLRKPLISIVFATFTLIITDYGVPLMVGGKFSTLPVLMYQEVIGLLNFGKGSVIGFVLMIPAVIAFFFDLLNSGNESISFTSNPVTVKAGKVRDCISYFICAVTALLVCLPIAAFCLLTLVKKYPVDMTFSVTNITKAMNLNAGGYLLNSIIIAIFVSIIGVVFSYTVAYFTCRYGRESGKWLHLISITSLAVPGIVLGLSYVLFFNDSIIYGTFAILILVNMIHFFASPYLLAYNSFGKINENLEAVGSTLGISRIYMLKDVFIPQMKSTILEMFSYFFVNSMMTISAVSFLATVNTMPVSLLITQFEAQMLLECSAFVSVLILFLNLSVKGMVYLVKRRILVNEGT